MPTPDYTCGCNAFTRFPCLAPPTEEDLLCDACRPDPSRLTPYLHWQPLTAYKDPNDVRANNTESLGHRTESMNRDTPLDVMQDAKLHMDFARWCESRTYGYRVSHSVRYVVGRRPPTQPQIVPKG